MLKEEQEKQARLDALNKSEKILHNIKSEIEAAGFEEGSAEYAEAFISKMLIQLNKALLENENLKIDVENLKKQIRK